MVLSGVGAVSTCRTVVLGAGKVGKTALLDSFVFGHFAEKYETTLADCYDKQVTLSDGLRYPVELLDTAGSIEFPAEREVAIRSGHNFLIIVSPDVPSSLDYATARLDDIKRIKGGYSERTVAVVINKRDTSGPAYRAFCQEVMRSLATSRVHICRASAKLGEGVDDAFTFLLHSYFGPYLQLKKKSRGIFKGVRRKLKRWFGKERRIVESLNSTMSDASSISFYSAKGVCIGDWQSLDRSSTYGYATLPW